MNNKLKLALLTSMVSTILVLPSPHAISAPAATQLVEMTQPDGSRVWLRKWGDEFAHGWETAQGVPVVKDDAGGYWYVAELDDAGRQTQSAQRLDLRQVLQPSAQHKLGGRNLKRDAQWHAQKGVNKLIRQTYLPGHQLMVLVPKIVVLARRPSCR